MNKKNVYIVIGIVLIFVAIIAIYGNAPADPVIKSGVNDFMEGFNDAQNSTEYEWE